MQKQTVLDRDAEAETMAKHDQELEAPDVFVLPPLLRKHMTAQIVKMGPAPFIFIDDMPVTAPEG